MSLNENGMWFPLSAADGRQIDAGDAVSQITW
jgi:hypothetical protein